MSFHWRNKILCSRRFKECCREIAYEERNRIFCRHDIPHLLDVARLMMILNSKEQLNINEKIIYAAALLHDIGRHWQYRVGIGHEISSALIAGEILRECKFSQQEINTITEAILHHRDKRSKRQKNLIGLLYRADKMSRACFCCPAANLCNWPAEKKNLSIQY